MRHRVHLDPESGGTGEEKRRAVRDFDQWLTPDQAAAYIGVAKITLAKWRITGSGPPFHRPKPRLIRYLRSELDAWIGAKLRSTSTKHGRASDG